MENRKIEAVVFDLDGTLIDSEPVALAAILEKCAEWGVPVVKEDAAVVAGKKWEIAFDLIFGRYKFPLGKQEAANAIIELYKKKTAQNLPIIPGAADAVRHFASRGHVALVSGSYREDIFFALEKLGVAELFSVVLGAEDYAMSKPSPEGYLKAFKELGVEGRQVLIFEDSAPGIKSGRDSGAVVAAITSTNYFGHDQSGAQLFVRDFLEVTPHWVRDVELKHF